MQVGIVRGRKEEEERVKQDRERERVEVEDRSVDDILTLKNKESSRLDSDGGVDREEEMNLR